MGYVFSNKGITVLDTAFGTASTILVLSVGEGAKFPVTASGDFFDVVFEDRRTGLYEICRCTSRTGDQLTLVRASQGTTARSWPAGTQLSHRVTAEYFNDIIDTLAALGTMSAQNSNDVAITGGTAADLDISGGTGTGIALTGGTADGMAIGQTNEAAVAAAFAKVIHDTAAIFDLQVRQSVDDRERTRFRRTLTQYIRETTNNSANVAATEFVEELGSSGSTRKGWYLLGAEASYLDSTSLTTVGRFLRSVSHAPGVILSETGVDNGYNQTWLVQDAHAMIFQTRDNAGNYVSTDYISSKSMSGNVGAVYHEFRTNDQRRVYFDSDQFQYVSGSGGFQFVFNGTSDTLRPGSVSSMDLGDSARRWYQAWFSVSPNVSSDERLKLDPRELNEAERRAAAKIKVQTYRLKSNGKRKVGYIAQQIIVAMKSEGLDAEEYGLVELGADGFYGVDYDAVNAFKLG